MVEWLFLYTFKTSIEILNEMTKRTGITPLNIQYVLK